MKILQINKFFWQRDGATNYFLAVRELLKQRGHTVIDFAMAHPNNLLSPYSDYFVSEVDFNNPKNWLAKIKMAGRIIYSFEAKRKLEALIKAEKPDIAHLHNVYHQIPSSVVGVLKKYKIPIVITLHDYKLICPGYLLFARGQVCERCKKHKYYQAVWHRCLKNSFWRSAVVALEAYCQNYRPVDCFIAPSRFMKDKCVEFGVPEKKIKCFWHFFNVDSRLRLPRLTAVKAGGNDKKEGGNDKMGDYLLYFGRLSGEKGIDVLLKAIADKNIKVKIVGAGPIKQEGNVEWLGYKTGEELKNLIANSLAVVVPSIWYENASASVFEAMALGKPVIASDIGGLPELVQDKITGLLFKAGDSVDLAAKIGILRNDSDLVKQMGQNSREWAAEMADPEKHYRELVDIYETLTK